LPWLPKYSTARVDLCCVLFGLVLAQVIPGRLYIGNREQANNWTLLQALKATHIVNVSRETKASFEGTVLAGLFLRTLHLHRMRNTIDPYTTRATQVK